MDHKRLGPALFTLALAGTLFASTVTVQYNTVKQTLDPHFHGMNFVAYWNMGDPHDMEMADMIKLAGIKVIRFPGGIPCDWYDWQNPGSIASSTEMRDFANRADAVLMFQTPAIQRSDGAPISASHMVDWVQHCKDNNVPVPYFEIGNEPDLPDALGCSWELSTYDPSCLQPYWNSFNSQASAINNVHPDIEVFGPAVTSYGWENLQALQHFKTNCEANIESISIHYYTQGGGQYEVSKTAAQVWQLVSIPRKLKPLFPTERIFVSEWSTLSGTEHNNYTGFTKTFGLAICNADVIGAMANGGITGHQMFGSTYVVDGNYGMWAYTTDFAPFKTPAPQYYIYPIWNAMGRHALHYTVNPNQEFEEMSAWAHKKDDGSVQVMLINKTGNQRTETIAFNGYDPTGAAITKWELKAANGQVTSSQVTFNGTTMPLSGAISSIPGPNSAGTCSGSTYDATIAPYSITVFDFQGGGTPIRLSLLEKDDNLRVNWDGAGHLAVTLPQRRGGVTASVYDLAGQKIDDLAWGGSEGHELLWNAERITSSMYILQIRMGAEVLTHRLPVCN